MDSKSIAIERKVAAIFDELVRLETLSVHRYKISKTEDKRTTHKR